MNNILEYLEKTSEKDFWREAVDDGVVCLSRKELLDISRRIGTVLTKMIKPGKPVVVLMEKSAVTLAAMFGVVYAGCFYAVVDPDQPIKRIENIIHVLSPEVVLLNNRSKQIISSISCSGRFVFINDCLMEKEDMNRLDQIRKDSKDTDPLYCMFTSGSTGTPKGIVVNHRAVIDFISGFINTFQITDCEKIGNQAPFDFDVSVKDIYSSVFTGAELILIPKKMFSVPPVLLDYLCEKNVTTLIWAASALALVSSLKGLEYRVPTQIKKVMFSGEVLPIQQLRRWQEALPEAEFVNLYGPTEITCNCTYYRINRVFEENEKVPIGKPFPGREVFLIDRKGQLITENDLIGEICVTGTSLSNGYYHAEEETKRRFFHTCEGRRYYKTGDLGYWGKDHELYFSGRKDFQIKIMGKRVELEEVESVVNQMEGVQKCCCVYYKERCQIIAYFCGEAEGRELRKQLKERLPAYMIPKRMIQLKQIPLNKNGKTDRTILEGLRGTAI